MRSVENYDVTAAAAAADTNANHHHHAPPPPSVHDGGVFSQNPNDPVVPKGGRRRFQRAADK